MSSAKLQVRHILFKKIRFFDFLKESLNHLIKNNLLFNRKNQKPIFTFQSMPNLQFCRSLAE